MNPVAATAYPRAISNAAEWLLAPVGRDDAIAIDPDITYGQLRARVDALAELLAERWPATARIILMPQPTPQSVVEVLGVMRAALTAVFIAPNAGGAEIAAVLQSAAPDGRLGEFRTRTSQVAHLPDALSTRGDQAATDDRAGADDVALIIYTSGTASTPKGVMLTHRNVIANVTSVLEAVELQDRDVVSLVLPLHYSFGLSMLCIGLRSRARLVLHRGVHFPDDIVEDLAEHRTTILAGVPYFFHGLARVGSRFSGAALPHLRTIIAAGGGMSREQLSDLRARFPAARVSLAYGQTEATARISHLPFTELNRRAGSIGRGIPGVELLVLDGNGRPVAPGEEGEIYVRGKNVMAGYVGDPEGTREVLTPWGLRTRDRATVDADGFVYVLGRNLDFVKFRGVRISLLEVEAAAERAPYVLEAAAHVEAHADGAEELVLDVVFSDDRPADTMTALRTHLVRSLAPGKRPTELRAVPRLPRTANGKKLRRPAAPPPPAR